MSGRRLAWHSLLNVAGQGLPVLVALVAVPVLVRGLGAERFGLLTLGWAVVGYFSFLDLGLGRALTQLVAERTARDEREGLDATVRAALLAMLALGVAGAVACALLASPTMQRWVTVSPALRGEAVRAFLWVAAAVPCVVLTTGLRGVLEAHHRFDLVNAIRAPLGVLTYAAPVALLAWSTRLDHVMALLLATRVVGLGAHAWAVGWVMPGVIGRRAWGVGRGVRSSGVSSRAYARDLLAPDRQQVPRDARDDTHGAERLPPPASLLPLIASGGWMTVSGALTPLLVTIDRFVVGAVASAAVVAYYAAPYEMATKLLIVPGAIFASVFPAFAATLANGRDDAQARALFGRALGLIAATVLPATLLLVAFAPELLRLWLGAEFAARSSGVLRLLAVGILFNALAHVPIALVQATGRADLAARLHLAEVVPYLAALLMLTRGWGAEGAALAWTLRAAVDAVALFVLARKVAPGVVRLTLRGPESAMRNA